jgi:hypothetical protein
VNKVCVDVTDDVNVRVIVVGEISCEIAVKLFDCWLRDSLKYIPSASAATRRATTTPTNNFEETPLRKL